MKTCGKCVLINACDCGKHGYCDVQQGFYKLDADASDCDYYDGPSDEPDTTERDNPRDPIIERRQYVFWNRHLSY